MRKNLRFFLVMFFLAFHFLTFGQERTVTGNVTDETGAPLPGVSVLIQGTTSGTITDIDGNYSITLEEGQDVLRFSFIGFKNQSIEVGTRSVVDVQMVPETRAIDEVVVVGYGTMKKSDVSTASVSVSGDDLEETMSANLDQALQGRAAGVTAITTSGQPGASVSIRIRGQSTLSSGAAEPLYVVDGVPIQNVIQGGHDVGIGDRLGNGPVSTFGGGLSSINPSDIESMEILKDASATAIYGSRGANGVVLITTKRGKTGEPRFNYNFEYGIQEQAKRIDVLNLREYAKYSNNIAAETDGRESREELLDPGLLGEGTDWQEAVFQSAPMQKHQISASGGTEKSRYFISGSYFDQEGIVVGSGYDRFTGRVNLDVELKDWWDVGTNLTFAQSEDDLGLNNSDEGIINVALKTSPDVPVYNVDGSWSGDEREGSPGKINPIAKALDEEIRLERTNFIGNIYSDITFIEGLDLRTEASLNIGNTDAYTFLPTYQYGNVSNTQNSSR